MTKASHLCESLQGGGRVLPYKSQDGSRFPVKSFRNRKNFGNFATGTKWLYEGNGSTKLCCRLWQSRTTSGLDLNQAMMVTIKDKGYGRMKQGSVKAYRLLASAPSATARESTSEARTLRSRFRPLASPSSSLCREQSAGHRMHCWWSLIKC